MSKFKKVLMALLMAMMMLFSVIGLVACNDPDDDDGGDNGDDIKFEDYAYNYGGESADDGDDTTRS